MSETNEVQPAPNTITTFATNIPVQRNTINGFLAVDLIGVSARSGTGSLPLFSTGSNNTFQLTEPGSVNAGFFYPRVGALPNDVGGGRREEGIPGIELLMQWTWVPGTVGPVVTNTAVGIASGRAAIDILCNGNAVCRGVIELLGGARAARSSTTASIAASRRQPVSYGSQKYAVKSGAIKAVRVALNRKAKAALKRQGSLQVRVKVQPERGRARTVMATLTN